MLLALWPYADRAAQTYLGVGAYLMLPTGSYDHARVFNLGQNRIATALQVGLHAPMVETLSWMAAVDAVWFGKNNDFGPTRATLQQRPLYTAQAGLRYDFNQKFSLGLVYFYTVGGETEVNGVERDDPSRIKRYQATAMTHLPVGRVALQYGADFSTENGFIEHRRWLLRYTIAF